jgi:hypothetical protein
MKLRKRQNHPNGLSYSDGKQELAEKREPGPRKTRIWRF